MVLFSEATQCGVDTKLIQLLARDNFLPIKTGIVSRHMQRVARLWHLCSTAESPPAGAGASVSGSWPGCHFERDIHIALNDLDTK